MKQLQFVVYLFILNSFLFTVNAQPYYKLPSIKDTAQFNKGIAHTAWLLTSSNKSHPHTVRILVYGQSISEQNWWKDVKKFVENKFPLAHIIFINKAIGGFSSDRLKIMVENDVVSFYPDLILFHDYGNEADYEKIIQVIRGRTTAEIAVQTDHMAVQNQEWHDRHNEVWLPQIVKKYGLALIDVRHAWKTYLQENKLNLKDLLIDGVHLNEHGNYLMAGIIKKYFETLSTALPVEPYTTILIEDKRLNFKKKHLNIPVIGNRIDFVWKPNARSDQPILVYLNQKKPSATTSCYYYTRPSLDTATFFLKKIGQLMAMKLTDKAREEDWMMTVTWTDSVQQQIGFTLNGSLTGEDGNGCSDTVFISRSGKIIIEPHFWFRAKEFANFPWLTTGDVLQWQVRSMCKDKVNPASFVTTVIQGVENRSHQLQLKGKAIRYLESIKVYAPPLQ
jgi:hypothetical protein